jgi:hypothetical protein
MRGHFGFVGGLVLIAAAAAATGCSDDPRPDGGGTPPASGGAILNSDFLSTSLSLIDTQAALVRADCIHSTTLGTGSKTISGDVVLPSQPQRGGKIVLIDRGNTALTFVDPSTCTVDRQFSVKGGFEMANPHDVVIVDDGKAYVTRYAKNAAPADPMAAGDDLLIVDPRDGTVTGRVDLAAYATVDFPASPDRAIVAAGKVVVTLNRWNASTYGYGDASVVFVDPTTDQVVQNLALPGMKNCEGLDYADSTKTVLVACGGSFGATDQAQESGVAVIDVSSSPAQLARVLPGTSFPTPPVTFLWAIPLPSASSPNRAFTSTLGSLSPESPDNLYAFDFVSGAPLSFGTAMPFNLGRPAGGNGRLLVPDADMATPRIHVYDVSGAGAPTEGTSFVADSVNLLPPREIAWY